MEDPRSSTAGAGAARGTGGTDSTGGDGSGTAAFADCVVCGEPTEHPATTAGATLCPVCAWQEAERRACSG